MMKTEQEAKQCWCPFARHQNGSGGVGVNRVNWDSTYSYANCIASACMAWRWANEPDGETPAYRRTRVKDSPGHFDNEPLGYCGLAGAPNRGPNV